jgi:hypothetical protein
MEDNLQIRIGSYQVLLNLLISSLLTQAQLVETLQPHGVFKLQMEHRARTFKRYLLRDCLAQDHPQTHLGLTLTKLQSNLSL